MRPSDSQAALDADVERLVKGDSAQVRLDFLKREAMIHRLWRSGKGARRAEFEFADLSGLTLDGLDLESAVLTGVNLAKARLRGANLVNAVLTGADLEEADLSDANLTGAELRGANLHRARLAGATLRGADLCARDLTTGGAPGGGGDERTRTVLTEANLERAILCHAKLADCDCTGADLGDADLAGADLSGSVMIGVDLEGAKLDGAVMTGTVIDPATLDADSIRAIAAIGGTVSPHCPELDTAAFIQAIKDHEAWVTSGGGEGRRLDLDRMSLPAVRMTGRNLAGCRLRRCQVAGGEWLDVDLSMADLSYTTMNGISLREGKLRGVTLRRASLAGADLSQAVFTALPLARGGHVWPANLEGVNLSGANLSGACLDGAILRKADLTGCVVDGISVRNADFTGAKR